MNWILIIIMEHAIRSHLEFFFASHIMTHKHVIRKWYCWQNLIKTPYLRFDGRIFKTEPSSNHPHQYVNVLGIYKEQPFVTGSNTLNKKTEILDYISKQWNVVADYPFSSGDRWLFQLVFNPLHFVFVGLLSTLQHLPKKAYTSSAAGQVILQQDMELL